MSHMQYRRMGRTGLKVSEFCLGTMTFGHGADEAEARQIVDYAIDAGVNFFDTANSYSNGQSEVLLGKALRDRRESAILATKFFNPMGDGPNDSGTSRKHILHAIEESLSRLRTDYVDLYYIHHVDVQTPLEEVLRALDDLVRQGKVRYVACSNYEAWQLADALWTSEANRLARIECYQPQYSLVVRDIEQELTPLCLHKGVGVVCWGSLAGGFLSGKYKPGDRRLSGTRSEEGWAFPDRYFAANADATLGVLLKIAEDLNRTPAQVALRWVLEQPAVTSVISGTRTLEQLQDNLGCVGWSLDSESLQQLDSVSKLPDRYPAAMEKDMYQRRENALRRDER